MLPAMLIRVAALLVLPLVAFGCGGGESSSLSAAGRPPASLVAGVPDPFAPGAEQAPGTFVGTTGGADYVGFVVSGGQAVVYVCDGASGDWFGGPVKDGRIALKSDAGTEVDAKVGDGAVAGTVRRKGGESERFTARPPGADEGLFAGPDASLPGAVRRWIVTADGIRGVTTSGKGSGGTVTATSSGGAQSSGAAAPAT